MQIFLFKNVSFLFKLLKVNENNLRLNFECLHGKGGIG